MTNRTLLARATGMGKAEGLAVEQVEVEVQRSVAHGGPVVRVELDVGGVAQRRLAGTQSTPGAGNSPEATGNGDKSLIT